MKLADAKKLTKGQRIQDKAGNVYTVRRLCPVWNGFKLSKDNREADSYMIDTMEDAFVDYKKVKVVE